MFYPLGIEFMIMYVENTVKPLLFSSLVPHKKRKKDFSRRRSGALFKEDVISRDLNNAIKRFTHISV